MCFSYTDDYVEGNLASCGYLSLGGDYRASYGSSSVKLIVNTDDGSFVDPKDSESLCGYVVMSQNIAPNTELKLEFTKKSDGTEYDNLVDRQSIEEIELYVRSLDS